MKIQLRDVLSLSGRDYVVEGLISYQMGGRTSVLARAVDGAGVIWIEPPAGDGRTAISTSAEATDDRLFVLHEIKDLDLSVPPPESVSYHGVSYVLRLTGRAMLAVKGEVPGRAPGTAQLWRYRTAGDQILQIEEEHGSLFMLAGQSVHRGMIDHLPGR
jgi:hypothetical protein